MTYFKLNFYKEAASGCHSAYASGAEWWIWTLCCIQTRLSLLFCLCFQMVSQLETQISELVAQLENEAELHRKALQRAQEAESKVETLQGQLSQLEGELLSGDVLRDNLNLEKQKVIMGTAHLWCGCLPWANPVPENILNTAVFKLIMSWVTSKFPRNNKPLPIV